MRFFRRPHNFFAIGGTPPSFFMKFMPCFGLHKKIIGRVKFGRIGHICARGEMRAENFQKFFPQLFARISLILLKNMKKCFFFTFKAEKYLKTISLNFEGRQKFLHHFGQFCPQPNFFFLRTQILNFQIIIIFVLIHIFP